MGYKTIEILDNSREYNLKVGKASITPSPYSAYKINLELEDINAEDFLEILTHQDDAFLLHIFKEIIIPRLYENEILDVINRDVIEEYLNS